MFFGIAAELEISLTIGALDEPSLAASCRRRGANIAIKIRTRQPTPANQRQYDCLDSFWADSFMFECNVPFKGMTPPPGTLYMDFECGRAAKTGQDDFDNEMPSRQQAPN